MLNFEFMTVDDEFDRLERFKDSSYYSEGEMQVNSTGSKFFKMFGGGKPQWKKQVIVLRSDYLYVFDYE